MDLPLPWTVDDTVTFTGVRAAAGGIAQDGEDVSAVVYVEVTGTRTGSDQAPSVYRFVIPLDLYFQFMVALEHAGKVAMLMPV